MNKLLITISDSEAAANAGLKALQALHASGDITLYATGVMARDAKGLVSVKKPLDPAANGTAIGFAVGSLIGLLGGPVGMAVGAVTGTVVGAVRDFWVTGVALDFIEEANKHLLPGKVALVAEVEEEWVFPVDMALEAAGGQVFRGTRTEVSEARFDHDVLALKAEVKALEAEASHAVGETKDKVVAKLAVAQARVDAAVHRAEAGVDTLKHEADAKLASLSHQLGQATGEVKAKIEGRLERVKKGYHSRGAKLSQAWSLTKQALAGS